MRFDQQEWGHQTKNSWQTPPIMFGFQCLVSRCYAPHGRLLGFLHPVVNHGFLENLPLVDDLPIKHNLLSKYLPVNIH